MKKIPLFVFCFLGLNVYAQQWQWAKKINSISAFDQNCIVADTSGNYYLATSYGCNSGACSIGIIVSKYDNNGLLIWSDNLIMPSQNTYPYYVPHGKLKIKGHYLYLTCQFANSVFFNDTSIISKGKQDIIIVKYQLNGVIQKIKTIGGIDEDNLNDIYIDNEQNIYLIGSFINSCFFSPDSLTHSKGREDLFVAKYNPNGDLTFFKQAWSLDTSLNFIFTDYVRGANVVVNSEKEIILTGSYNKGLVMDSIIDNYINDDGWKIFILRIDSIGNLTAIYYPPSLYQSSSLSNIFINENDDIFLLRNSWFAHGGVNSINKYNYNGTITSLIDTFSSDTEHNNINGFLFDNKENLIYIGSCNSPYGTVPINMFY
ncbi:MAG: hypothetical protein K8R85_06765, partial [Bacteroidetes bacterium]|nr:hypothetical protein [Bacteroidota bacterium]